MKNIERREFVGSVASVLGLASLDGSGIKDSFLKSGKTDQTGRTVTLKGRQDSRVRHLDIITIGNLSRNRYWGEGDERSFRSAICTCSVISGENFHLIVDPSLADETAMITELKKRTGLSPDNIDAVFITHQHGDHIAGLRHFQKARWFSGSDVAEGLNKSAGYSKKIEPAGDNLFGAIDVIPAPGHTPDLQILRFDYKGLSVVIAGDAVATKDFWDEKRAYYNVMDEEESRRSMEKIDTIADIIVPGHDNYFLNLKIT
jgi:glyoxylase-like metal-dependent hydrolase (beta-lactamase superfamily II)